MSYPATGDPVKDALLDRFKQPMAAEVYTLDYLIDSLMEQFP